MTQKLKYMYEHGWSELKQTRKCFNCSFYTLIDIDNTTCLPPAYDHGTTKFKKKTSHEKQSFESHNTLCFKGRKTVSGKAVSIIATRQMYCMLAKYGCVGYKKTHTKISLELLLEVNIGLGIAQKSAKEVMNPHFSFFRIENYCNKA